MFWDRPDLKILYIYILQKNMLFTKLTYFDHPNKKVKRFYWRLIRI